MTFLRVVIGTFLGFSLATRSVEGASGALLGLGMIMNLPQLYVERFLKIDAEIWADKLTMFTGFPAAAGMLILTWTVFHSSNPKGAAYLADAMKAAALGKLAKEQQMEAEDTRGGEEVMEGGEGQEGELNNAYVASGDDEF